MKAQENTLLGILGEPNTQFIAPIFQRVYSWTKNQCSVFLEDVKRAGKTDQEHFVGVFLYAREADSTEGYSRCQIVDGQQRMTTLTLILIAFIDWMREHNASVPATKDAFSQLDATELAKCYLFAGAKGNSLKLLLTASDRDMLEYLIGAGEEPEDISSQLQGNLAFFKEQMNRDSFDYEQFWRGLQLLTVIEIELDEHDQPQRVFESINSKGLRLNLEDILRNSVLMDGHFDELGLSPIIVGSQDDRRVADADRGDVSDGELDVFVQLWEPIEDAFDKEPQVTIDDMICCWLASLYSSSRVESEDDLLIFLQDALAKRYGGSYGKMLRDLQSYSSKFLSDDNARREAMKKMEKWRQGIPLDSISQYRMFGD